MPDSARAATSRDIELFRAIAARGSGTVESALRGASMGEAIPDGATIRITHRDPSTQWRPGQVVAFLAGTRIMAHRVVHVGRRGRAGAFLITEGDGNWMCDPPIAREAIAGEVAQYLGADGWRDVPPARRSLLRRGFGSIPLALMRAALEAEPRVASGLGRAMSIVRMSARGLWLAVAQLGKSRVRD